MRDSLEEQYREAQRRHADAFYAYGKGHPFVVYAREEKESLWEQLKAEKAERIEDIFSNYIGKFDHPSRDDILWLIEQLNPKLTRKGI